jgi:predicted DNA-binding protein with PD1-like motif
MKYTEAKPGRIFVARFDDSENLLEGLKQLIIKENIKTGLIHLMGAISKSKLVLGPEERAYPPTPSWWAFDDAREVLGLAIFAWENNEPKIHLHAGVGHFSESKIGCIREQCDVYLTIEAVIQEITGADITRKLDTRYNASLLNIE